MALGSECGVVMDIQWFTGDDVHGPVLIMVREGVTSSVPFDPANTDYQRYLEWVAAGNVPQPWEG